MSYRNPKEHYTMDSSGSSSIESDNNSENNLEVEFTPMNQNLSIMNQSSGIDNHTMKCRNIRAKSKRYIKAQWRWN